VRISPIEVFDDWPASGPSSNKPSKVSPDARRRDVRLSRYCDTRSAASGGLQQRARA